MSNTINDLFPLPSPLPSKLSPSFWPGINHESTQTLLASLKGNHEKYHVYFDPKGFHNHIAHYVLALWGLGAPAEIISAAYQHDSHYQLAAFESPELITEENYKHHLGDDKFYTGYRKFFANVIRKKGVWVVLEEYVFRKASNFDDDSAKQPEMLSRFLDSLLHPMIHVGYGVEFGLPGIVVEGLASMAIHKASATSLLPPSMWSPSSTSLQGSLASRVSSALNLGSEAPRASTKNVHALTILARVLKDAQFEAIDRVEDLKVFNQAIERHGEALFKHASAWTINAQDPKEVERKIEELVWMNVIIYGIGGWARGEAFNTDFFHMHLVTSAIFLPSLVSNLKATSVELLLRGYLAYSLAWWVGRGRPDINIAGFFAEDTAHPVPSGPFPTPHAQSLPSNTSVFATTPNPWFSIIQAAIVIPDEHLPKLHRALAHFGSLYGTRAPAQPDFVDTELPSAEKLDGSLFIRTAGLTNERLLRTKDLDVSRARFWDRQGFYKH